MKKTYWLIVLLGIFGLLGVSYFILNTNYSVVIKNRKTLREVKPFRIAQFFNGSKKDIRTDFPHIEYLKCSNKDDIQLLLSDLKTLDSIFHTDKQANQEVLSIALTNKLEETIKPSLTHCDFDSLVVVLQWAEKFKAYSEIDKEHEMLFQVVYNHWVNVVANQLATCYEADAAIKHDFRFKYISGRCSENAFNIPVGNSKVEKVLENIIENKWSYIFNRFWIGTTILFKISIFLFIAITLIAYWSLFRLVRSKINHEKIS